MLTLLTLAACGPKPEPPRTVKTTLQTRPGGPPEEAEITIMAAPDHLADVAAVEMDLPDDELVMGVVIEGQAMAYPIRYMGMEIANHRIGNTPVAPSW